MLSVLRRTTATAVALQILQQPQRTVLRVSFTLAHRKRIVGKPHSEGDAKLKVLAPRLPATRQTTVHAFRVVEGASAGDDDRTDPASKEAESFRKWF